MRILLLFRGAPGCGKSTFIDQNGLRPYALSADEIKKQGRVPDFDIDTVRRLLVNEFNWMCS